MEKQIQILFEPKSHTYTGKENGLNYISATTIIGKYKKPFNKAYWSMYVALRDSGIRVRPEDSFKGIYVNNTYRTLNSLYKNPVNCLGVNNLINKWDKITKHACDRGNKIHDYLETVINESKDDNEGKTNNLIKPSLVDTLKGEGLSVVIRTKHDLDSTDLSESYPDIYKRLLSYINMGCTIFAEKRIYTTKYLVAGMIDVLIIKGKQFAILDWKTNKEEMLFRSGYYKKVKINNEWVKTDKWVDKKSYLLTPINNLEDCKGIIYSLQLSLYAFIMELWGYTLVPNGLEIFHIRIGLAPKLIRVKYLKNEIQKLLTYHKNKTANSITSGKGFGVI